MIPCFLQQTEITIRAECCGAASGVKAVKMQRRENGGRVRGFM